MEINQHIKLAKKLLEINGVIIYSIFYDSIFSYVIKNNRHISIICSETTNDELIMSVSVDGKANLKISQKLIQKIFGKRYSVERHLNKVDGQQANYFKLTVLRA
ncbi:hypothetical protein [Volucribacter amazonae]|uniref:Uncharacterized protein n=1 Tax=Volucribacter amazonae TaxID=256731 RepID=A0A9X4PC53_9PAST|nr:hypothetical protein [Volucribacter amazonae]MDG6894544.1 hypothetical protein [Volucribacter amazonae]